MKLTDKDREKLREAAIEFMRHEKEENSRFQTYQEFHETNLLVACHEMVMMVHYRNTLNHAITSLMTMCDMSEYDDRARELYEYHRELAHAEGRISSLSLEIDVVRGRLAKASRDPELANKRYFDTQARQFIGRGTPKGGGA